MSKHTRAISSINSYLDRFFDKTVDFECNITIFRYMSNHLNIDGRRFSEIFKALSNPNRLNIFLQLMSCCCLGQSCDVDTNDETCITVGELGQKSGVAPSTVSHHIKELYRSGLIKMERQGQQVKCWVDPTILQELADFFRNQQSC